MSRRPWLAATVLHTIDTNPQELVDGGVHSGVGHVVQQHWYAVVDDFMQPPAEVAASLSNKLHTNATATTTRDIEATTQYLTTHHRRPAKTASPSPNTITLTQNAASEAASKVGHLTNTTHNPQRENNSLINTASHHCNTPILRELDPNQHSAIQIHTLCNPTHPTRRYDVLPWC